jgi:hypothetical protein
LADEGEESPEFLTELDARIRALDHGGRTYSLEEARGAPNGERYRHACSPVVIGMYVVMILEAAHEDLRNIDVAFWE